MIRHLMHSKQLLITQTLKLVARLLSRYPGVKYRLKTLYLNYFPGRLGTPPVTVPGHDPESNPFSTHSLVLDFVHGKNTVNPLLTLEIGPCVLALKQNDQKTLDRLIQERKFCDIVVSCYLYILRRYPSDDDIKLWTNHLEKGIPIDTLIEGLKSSAEFQRSGIYYLEKGLPPHA